MNTFLFWLTVIGIPWSAALTCVFALCSCTGSATVRLSLITNGATIQLSHVGPGEVIIRDKFELNGPCNAKLVIQVDDKVTSSDVWLTEGIQGEVVKYEYTTPTDQR